MSRAVGRQIAHADPAGHLVDHARTGGEADDASESAVGRTACFADNDFTPSAARAPAVSRTTPSVSPTRIVPSGSAESDLTLAAGSPSRSV
jgi:hypothetical protein